jgi:hypothetical protein
MTVSRFFSRIACLILKVVATGDVITKAQRKNCVASADVKLRSAVPWMGDLGVRWIGTSTFSQGCAFCGRNTGIGG